MATNDIPVGSIKPNSNRFKEREAAKEKAKEKKEKSVKAVVSGKVKKKSLGERFKDDFIKEDMRTVGDYLLKEKIFPDILQLLIDSLSDGLSMHFGLNKRNYSNNRDGYTSYAKVSSYSYGGSRVSKSEPEEKKDLKSDFRDIIFKTKEDANEVLSSLQGFADEYDTTSVSDLYELSGITPKSFTDNNYGWTFDMLQKVAIRRVREGYILDLPNPIPVN